MSPAATQFMGPTIFLLYLLHGLYYFGWSLDDPYISYRYAENLALGHGLTFNVGEAPVEGFSNFTWVVLLAGLIRIGLDPVMWSRLLGLLLGVVPIAWLLSEARRSERRAQQNRGYLAAFAVAASASFAFWSVGGLETALLAALLAGAAWSFLREIAPGKRFKWPLSALLLGLAALTRPEAVMYFPIFFILAIMNTSVAPGRARRDYLISAILAFGIPAALFQVWRVGYFGSWLPNTFYAKATGDLAARGLLGAKYLGSFAMREGGLWVALALVGAVSAARRREPALQLAAGVVAAQILFIVYCGGDWMALSRFMVPALPFFFLLAADGAVALAAALKDWKAQVIGLLVAAQCIAGGYLEARATSPYLRGLENGKLYGQFYDLAAQLRDEYPPDTLLAGEEAGILPYVTEFRFLDLMGLTDAHLAKQPGAIHEKSDPDYVLGRGPDLVLFLLTKKWEQGTPPPTATRAGRELLTNPKFLQEYKLKQIVPRGDESLWGTAYWYLYEKKQDKNKD